MNENDFFNRYILSDSPKLADFASRVAAEFDFWPPNGAAIYSTVGCKKVAPKSSIIAQEMYEEES